MQLTIFTTHQPAADIRYLLHKNPGQSQTFKLLFGRADVSYPKADPNRCAVALPLSIDSVGLVIPEPGAPNS